MHPPDRPFHRQFPGAFSAEKHGVREEEAPKERREQSRIIFEHIGGAETIYQLRESVLHVRASIVARALNVIASIHFASNGSPTEEDRRFSFSAIDALTPLVLDNKITSYGAALRFSNGERNVDLPLDDQEFLNRVQWHGNMRAATRLELERLGIPLDRQRHSFSIEPLRQRTASAARAVYAPASPVYANAE